MREQRPPPLLTHLLMEYGLPLRIGLKVDVDTLDGLTKGVPALLDILAARGIRASFFLPR